MKKSIFNLFLFLTILIPSIKSMELEKNTIKSMEFEKNTAKKYSLEFNHLFCPLQKLVERSTAPLYALDKKFTVKLTLDDFDLSYPTKNKKKLKFEIYKGLMESVSDEILPLNPEYDFKNLTNADCKNFAKHLKNLYVNDCLNKLNDSGLMGILDEEHQLKANNYLLSFKLNLLSEEQLNKMISAIESINNENIYKTELLTELDGNLKNICLTKNPVATKKFIDLYCFYKNYIKIIPN